MRYEHIARAFFGQPWALMPEKLHAIADLIRLRAAGGHVSAEEIAAVVGAARQPAPRQSGGMVAVIPVYGVISPRATLMTESSGGTPAELVGRALDAALADPAVGSILMEFDSPGGSVVGMTELAAKIRATNATKPVTAHVNALAASAAYWLASQAGEVVVTPSGMVGSIGVFTEHADLSRALDAEGITPTLISAGKYKVEASPYEPLSADARAALQKMVDDVYGMFVADVAKGRRVSASAVRSGFGEGRVVSAKDAGVLGMVDRIASFDDTLARLAGRPRQARAVAAVLSDTEFVAGVGEALAEEAAGVECKTIEQIDAEVAAADIDIRRRRLALLGGR
ncbi:MAG: S49 family peptidase [Gemmatimonadales bacterium]|nr:S49 family peptidase [Gemmatimonadales bacterium]